MLVVNANAYEFDSRDSEQSLRLANAGREEFGDAEEFLAACPHASTTNLDGHKGVPFSSIQDSAIRRNITKFYGHELPADAEVFVIRSSWDHYEFVASFDSSFLWYLWSTSA